MPTVTVELERLPNVQQYDIGEVYDELWKWLEWNVHANALTKACEQVTYYYLGESKSDGYTGENECVFHFRDPGGYCSMACRAAAHWFELSIAMLDLNILLEPMGYRLAAPRDSLDELMDKGNPNPMVEIDTDLFCVSEHEGEYEIYSDYQVSELTFETLPKFSQQSIREMYEARQCRCYLCNRIRAGQHDPITLKPTTDEEPESTTFKRISKALRYPSHAEVLDVYEQNLTKIPPEIGGLTELRELSAWTNQVTELPPEIGSLRKLRVLDMGNNKLKELPPEIGQLASLVELNVRQSQLKELPEEIGQLKKLELLDLGNNQIDKLPKSFCNLTSLKRLSLYSLPLNHVPKVLCDLPNLRRLDLRDVTCSPELIVNFPFDRIPKLEYVEIRGESLTFPPSLFRAKNLTSAEFTDLCEGAIPTEIKNWTKLESLRIGDCKLTELPRELFDLKKLTWLNLSSNQLSVLPDEIGQLTKLESLYAGDNLFEYLPDSIGNLKQLRYLSLNRSKLKALPKCLEELPNLETIALFDCDNVEQLVAPLDLDGVTIQGLD